MPPARPPCGGGGGRRPRRVRSTHASGAAGDGAQAHERAVPIGLAAAAREADVGGGVEAEDGGGHEKAQEGAQATRDHATVPDVITCNAFKLKLKLLNEVLYQVDGYEEMDFLGGVIRYDNSRVKKTIGGNYIIV